MSEENDNDPKPDIDFSKLTKFRASQDAAEPKQQEDTAALLNDVRGWPAEIKSVSLNKGNGYAAVEYTAYEGTTGAMLIDPRIIPKLVERLLSVAYEAGVINAPVISHIKKIA